MKKQFIPLLTFTISLLIGGCSSNALPDDPHGRYIPKHPKWRFENTNPDPEKVIDYSSIYCFKNTTAVSDRTVWQTVRFWSSGQVMHGWTDDISSIEKLNSFKDTTVGYFKIDGREIITQTFTGIPFRKYGYGIWEIDGKGDLCRISFGQGLSNWRQVELDQPHNYKRIENMRLDSEPDW